LGVVRDIYILRTTFFVSVSQHLTYSAVVWCVQTVLADRGSHKSRGFKQKSCGRKLLGVVVVWLFSNGMKVM